MTTLFKEYSELMSLIASLEKKKDDLAMQLVEEIEADGLKEKKTPFGTFVVSGRRTYSYSPVVTQLQKAVYSQKKQEESDGTAELVRHSTFIKLMKPENG